MKAKMVYTALHFTKSENSMMGHSLQGRKQRKQCLNSSYPKWKLNQNLDFKGAQ